ncbi:MAG: hypothetical protein LBS62_08345 [Clostridiales bacterium]|jgi:hypothetical protein|nr:hypothetical protein [Clostridiales bacterium]
MESVQEWMREYLVGGGMDKVSFVGSINPRGNVFTLAVKIRQVLGLNKKWYEKSTSVDGSFKILREAISAAGIIIMMNGTVGGNTRAALILGSFALLRSLTTMLL